MSHQPAWANVAIIFRTVPEESNNCLVVGPKFLDDTNHNSFMKALESQEGQDSFELGSYLNRTSFPDGTNMLAFLHSGNYIKKIPTKNEPQSLSHLQRASSVCWKN